MRIKIAYSPENVVVTCLTRFLEFDPVASIRIPGVNTISDTLYMYASFLLVEETKYLK
jgi:hypothetical protein